MMIIFFLFDASDVGTVADTGMLGVEIDIQMIQMTLRSKHLAALNTDIANHPDVKMIFGESTMQASVVEVAEHRQVFKLVGLNHELHYWRTPHAVCPPLGRYKFQTKCDYVVAIT
jgi:xanthosine utilization system XapX-like protein